MIFLANPAKDCYLRILSSVPTWKRPKRGAVIGWKRFRQKKDPAEV
jgi:hypothetical protein